MGEWPMPQIEALLARRDIDRHLDVALLAEVGSSIHGINTDHDDLDLTAVRLEPWHEFVNGPQKRQSMMVRTAPEGVRSRYDDIDIQVYTLRKFVGLAVGGNPSILTALFSPGRRFGQFAWIDWNRLTFVVASKAAGQAFRGYMRQQLERWRGERGQRNVNRPELVEAHGYDTKYAGHVIRLGYQGIEYLTTGRLTLPMPEKERNTVLGVRRGLIDEGRALELAESVEKELEEAIDKSPLPEHPGKASARAWLSEHYGRHFNIGGRS